jgi:hypothetical protein
MDSGREERVTDERFPRRDFLKVTASTALTFGASVPATFSTAQPADFILKNAKVITVDANFSIAQATPFRRRRIALVPL